MDEMKNVLKEIDLQVVYKRLAERKKNITNDGKMSKRQLAAAYKGWHGDEARYYALTHMSDENMMKAEYRNQHLSQRHEKEMKQIQEHENYLKEESAKAIKAMRDDFTTMLAYQCVYKNNSLKNIEKARENMTSAKRKRPDSDKYDMFEKEKRVASSKAPRPLGSLREAEKYRDELKLKFPPIDNKNENKDSNERPHVNMFGEKQYESRTTSRNTNDKINVTSFPNIEEAMGVEIKYRNAKSTETDKDSYFSAPVEMGREASSDIRLESRTTITEYDMGQNLLLMRMKEQEKYERRRLLPQTPNQQSTAKNKIDRECKRRKLPSVPPRRPKLYPAGAKTVNDVQRIIRREATEILDFWSKDPKRLEEYERSKGFERPEPLQRAQTTTEMFRELKQFKKQDQQFKEQQVDDKSIIVRQLSPKPRPLSPVSTRMTEYSSRIPSPKVRDRSPFSKPKREGSEKIPSVSRTSSYKELPDGPIEIHENALLTAAERIEKERAEKERQNWSRMKLKMAQVAMRENETVEDTSTKIKLKRELPRIKKTRSLPQTKWDNDTAAINVNKDLGTEVKPIVRETSDIETIEAVSKANASKDDVLREFERRILGKPPLQPLSKNRNQSDTESWRMAEALDAGRRFHSERDAYTPLSRKTEPVRRRLTPILDTDQLQTEQTQRRRTPILDSGQFQKEPLKRRPTPISDTAVSDPYSQLRFSGITGLGKLPKKFSYDKFSRVPPDAKKRIEIRAKNKKKAQMHNANMEKERENGSVANADRPSTRVSFNEMVMVFQTI